MAAPTTIRGNKIRILLGTGGDPIVYVAPCGFVDRAISLSKSLQEIDIPDVDEDVAVTWIGRDAMSISMEVDGQGVLAAESAEIWVEAYEGWDSVPVKVEWEFATKTLVWTGLMVIGQLEAGAVDKRRATLRVSMLSDGELERVIYYFATADNASQTADTTEYTADMVP